MAFLREWIEVLTNPLAVAMLIGVVGAVGRVCGRPTLARCLYGCAVLVAYLGASPILGNVLIEPLERTYPSLRDEQKTVQAGYIVVLGSGYTPRDSIPITAALDEDGLVRIVEGVRLMRHLDVQKLVVSGGAPPGQGRPALGYAELARELGVSDSSLVILVTARDTAAEARAVLELLGQSPFILVTSAYHMPRAMRLMRRVGAHAIPAPTGQLAGRGAMQWVDLLPAAGGLRRTELALHEYVGLTAIAAHID